MREPTIYHCFSGKDRIRFEVHEAFSDRLSARQQARSVLPLPPEAEGERAREKRDCYEALVERIVEQAIEKGALRQVDVRLATFVVFGMCNWAYQWIDAGGRRLQREIAYTATAGAPGSPDHKEAR